MSAFPRTCAVLALLAFQPGCAGPGGESYTEHLLDAQHVWHGYPSRFGLALGYAPFLPLAAVEGLFTGTSPLSIEQPGFFGGCGLVFGMGLAHIVGTPFYVLGLPFESSTEDRGTADLDHEAAQRAEAAGPPVEDDPAEPRDGRAESSDGARQNGPVDGTGRR